MAKRRFHLSIRLKIVLLVASALSVSLLSYLYVGTGLLVDDKTSYIYDYNLSQVRMASESLESQLEKVLSMATTVAAVAPPHAFPAADGLSSRFKSLGVQSIVFERRAPSIATPGGPPSQAAGPETELEIGESARVLEAWARQVGWEAQLFSGADLLVSPASMLRGANEGKLVLASRVRDAFGGIRAFIALVQLNASLVGSAGGNTQLRLLHSGGAALLSDRGFERAVGSRALGAFEKNLLRGEFPVGATDWTSGGKPYLVSYRRMLGKRLLMVSYIPKGLAFTAADALVKRSLGLGISILFLAGGLTLLFVKGLTARIRDMWKATQRVAEGDFTVRVPVEVRAGDEISSLASSFNTMAEKIDELMLQTAEKARMEKELETAQLVQSRYFPESDFSHPNLRVAGRFVPASECGGDWWHYAQTHDHLWVVVGDVTGHGVHAALVTAAAHSTFSLYLRQVTQGSEPPSLAALVDRLHSGVAAAAGGHATMTFFASLIDLRTGEMKIINASHCPTYLFRKPADEPDRPVVKCFKPLIGAKVPPLGDGDAPGTAVDPHSIQLMPGDLLVWYTDGLLDCRAKDNAKISKPDLLKSIAAIAEAPGFEAPRVRDDLFGYAIDFFGSAANDRLDDITIVVGTIPKDAQFSASEPGAVRDDTPQTGQFDITGLILKEAS